MPYIYGASHLILMLTYAEGTLAVVVLQMGQPRRGRLTGERTRGQSRDLIPGHLTPRLPRSC